MRCVTTVHRERSGVYCVVVGARRSGESWSTKELNPVLASHAVHTDESLGSRLQRHQSLHVATAQLDTHQPSMLTLHATQRIRSAPVSSNYPSLPSAPLLHAAQSSETTQTQSTHQRRSRSMFGSGSSSFRHRLQHLEREVRRARLPTPRGTCCTSRCTPPGRPSSCPCSAHVRVVQLNLLPMARLLDGCVQVHSLGSAPCLLRPLVERLLRLEEHLHQPHRAPILPPYLHLVRYRRQIALERHLLLVGAAVVLLLPAC